MTIQVKYFRFRETFYRPYFLFKSVARMMHDVSNNLTPPNILILFIHQADIYPYETRSSQRGDYFLKGSRIDIQKISFSIIGVKVWKRVSSCEVRQMSKSNFKNNINDILFQSLLKYDHYIDVSIILANFDSSV